MMDAPSSSPPESAAASRKNSILVKEEQPASSVAVHPHFVEQPPLHRQPPLGLKDKKVQLSEPNSGNTTPPESEPLRGKSPKKESKTEPSISIPSSNTPSTTFLPMLSPTSSATPSLRIPSEKFQSMRDREKEFGNSKESSIDESSARAALKVPCDPRIPMDDGKIHILLGVTGSLHGSSVKKMIAKLQSIYGDGIAIQVILTPAADKIIASSLASRDAKEIVSLKKEHKELMQLQVWRDTDEWDTWRGRNDPVIHIELRRWADILVIAPMSANTLGKIAMGLCDNLLTNVVRAWNSQYPILVAPAMVSYAYNHPATKQHMQLIKDEMKWIEILRPTEKVAGSTGGIGMGGMMPWNEIVDKIVQRLGGYPSDNSEDEDDEEDETRNDNSEEDEDDDDNSEDDLVLSEPADAREYAPHSPI